MSAPPSLPDTAKPKLTWYQHVWLGWPIALVAVGGAIGGACGGAAWALNQKVFHSTRHPLMRYVWTGLISLAAIAVYLIAATVLLTFLPQQP